MAKEKNNNLTTGEKVGIGIALTTAAVAAAGAYFLAGSKNAAKNRKAVKSWALKAKAEVLEGLEKAKKMSQEEYMCLLDSVADVYKTAQNVSKKDIKEFKDEMTENWKKLEKNIEKQKKAAKKVVKKGIEDAKS